MEFMHGEDVELEGAYRWTNPDGTRGGYVADSAAVDPTAFIDSDAFVMHGAVVGPGARIKAGYYVRAGESNRTISTFSDP